MADEIKSPAQETPKPGTPPNKPEGEPIKEPPPATAKSKEGEPPATKVVEGAKPVEYDLKVPDGALLESGRLESIAAFAKEKGLSQDDAQALVEREATAVTSYVESEKKKLSDLSETWKTEVKADKEIGGEKSDASVGIARRALSHFGSENLTKMLEDSGFGNHPEVIRVFYRIGKAMSEDKLINPGAIPSTGKLSNAEVLYGNKKEEPKK